MPTKCWLHGETGTEKPTKPLKEHPGWPDRTKDYQQNLALILTPTPKDPFIKTYRWYDFQVLTEERDLLLEQVKELKNLEKKAKSLWNTELPSEKFEEEIIVNLKPLFANADLPLQLWDINKIFETDDYEDFPSRPSSRSSSHSSRPSSPTGEDWEKIQQLKEAVKFYSTKADGYLQNLTKLEAENDNKDLEIQELKATIRQLKKLSETEQEKTERERLERERKQREAERKKSQKEAEQLKKGKLAREKAEKEEAERKKQKKEWEEQEERERAEAERLAKERQKSTPKTPKPEKKQPAKPTDRSNWFTPEHWLTDAEIDWALKQVIGELPEVQAKKYKIIPAMTFFYIRIAGNSKEADAYMSFPFLLNDLANFKGDLVFIPVCDNDFHWSLLVYDRFTRIFYHYDTLNGANYEYAKPLVGQLLQQIHQNNDIDLNKYLIPRHNIKQGNTWDCGVAVIAIAERIIKQGINGNFKDLNENYFGKERLKWWELANIN